MARQTKLTWDVVRELEKSIESGATYEVACDSAGISERTFYRWKNGEFPRDTPKEIKWQFWQILTRARGRGAVEMVDVVRTAAKNGDWRAALALLERWYPDSFGRRSLEIKGSETAPLTIVFKERSDGPQ